MECMYCIGQNSGMVKFCGEEWNSPILYLKIIIYAKSKY